MPPPHTCKWGIISTGMMAQDFIRDILQPPAPRGNTDIVHQVTAIASALGGTARAQSLIDEFSLPSCIAYGSYAELVQDPAVDIVYVASPHPAHYADVKLALSAGKNVLNEKPFTMNAAQARALYALASEKNLFLMDAHWTRFLPSAREVTRLLTAGRIGPVKRVFADFSFDLIPTPGISSRFTDRRLGAGALIDLGLYTLTWIFLAVGGVGGGRGPPRVLGAHSIPMGSDEEAVDDGTTLMVGWPDVVGIGTCAITFPPAKAGRDALLWEKLGSLDGTGEPPAVRIQGPLGEIALAAPAPYPGRVWVNGEPVKDVKMPEGTMGWVYMADEVARCVRDGKKRCEIISEEESVAIMDVLDEVRRQCGITYPEEMEAL